MCQIINGLEYTVDATRDMPGCRQVQEYGSRTRERITSVPRQPHTSQNAITKASCNPQLDWGSTPNTICRGRSDIQCTTPRLSMMVMMTMGMGRNKSRTAFQRCHSSFLRVGWVLCTLVKQLKANNLLQLVREFPEQEDGMALRQKCLAAPESLTQQPLI